MKKTIILLLIALLCSSGKLFSQRSLLRKGDKAFEKEQYATALSYFEKAEMKKGDKPQTKIKIARCYYLLDNYTKALEYYAKVKTTDFSGQDFLYLADLYRTEKKYPEAINLYQKAIEKGVKKDVAKARSFACDWAIENESPNEHYQVKQTGIAIKGDAMGVQFFQKGIVYATNHNDKADEKGRLQRNLVFATYNDGKIGSPEMFSKEIASEYHQGAPSFTGDNLTVYFTRIEKDDNENDIAKIYKADYSGTEWQNIESMPFNSNNYSCKHPAISADGNSIIFASDIKNGQGGFDLYVSYKIGENWGNPVSVGKKVNTPGDELYPYLDENDILYFASDGQPGYGGLDIFSATKAVMDWENVTNLKAPVNSPKNDFSFVINPNKPDKALLISNRTGNGTIDYIFDVNTPEQTAENEKEYSASVGEDDVSYFDKRYKELLGEYGIKTPSQLSSNKRREFYDKLYSEEKYYSDEVKNKLKEYHASSISQLSDLERKNFYEELHGEQNSENNQKDKTNNVSTNPDDTENRQEAGVVYKVQFKSSKVPLSGVKGFDGQYVFRYFYKGWYRYTVGNFTDVESADKLKQKAIELGYSDAFVVAFKDGKRLEGYIIYKDR